MISSAREFRVQLQWPSGFNFQFKTLDSELDYVALVVDSEFQKLQEAAGTKQLNQVRSRPFKNISRN